MRAIQSATDDGATQLVYDLGCALADTPKASNYVEVSALIQLVVDVVSREVAPSTNFLVGWPDEPLELTVNRSALALALLHVIRSAVDAANTNANGEVRITMRRGYDGAVRVEVNDNGPLMDASAVRHAFEPFFSKAKGRSVTGLPLASALIRSIGGTIDLESTPARGTRATLVVGADTA
jgi:signal transduction histidine kinase